ncbi:4537_t:CDS:1, partial [Cetraspora pellucida]
TSKYSENFGKNIENKISENKLNQIDKQNHIKMLQEKIDQLKVLQNTVDNIVIQFTQFLMQNAIAAFNDAYVEYLDYIIHIERENVDNTSENYDNNILEALEEIKRKYNEEVKIIKEMIENNEPSSCSLSSEDILDLEQQLHGLPNVGKYLQAIKEEEKRAFKYQEKRHKFPNMLNFLQKILTNPIIISNCS